MSCDLTKGKITLECKDAVSGIRSIMVANYDDYGFVVNSSDTGHDLTDLGSLTTVYRYVLENSANTFQQDITPSSDNGTTLYTQVVNFTLTKINHEMEYQIKMMSMGRPIIFVEMKSGQIFVMGKDYGTEVTGNSQVGGTIDALNAYVMTATANESEPVYYLDDTAKSALLALVSADNI